VDKTTQQVHVSHRAAPGAAVYRGHEIHIKGKEHKIEKLLKKTKKAEAS